MHAPNCLSAWCRLLPVLLLSLLLTACGGDGDDNDDDANFGGTPTDNFQLQVLHAADMEGGAEAVEDAPRFSAILDALRAENPDITLVLSSGDAWIPGPFYSASDDDTLSSLLGVVDSGRGDMLMLNAMDFQASAFGNHEFDEGPDTVFSILAEESGESGIYPGADFPYLSVNLDFSADEDLSTLVTADGQNVADLANRIAGSAVVTVDGETIGLVGATTPALASISSTGDVVVLPEDGSVAGLANLIQEAVDALTAQGIDKIILLAHMQQLSIERELAGLLSDVDIIIGGGSDSILADATDRLRVGDTAVDIYPIELTSATGEPVLLVNTDGQYRYVGRLVVEFDDNGVVLPDSIDSEISGAYATDEQGLVELNGPGANPVVEEIANAIGEVLIDRESNTFGKTLVYLNGARASVRTEETNLGNLTADANLSIAQTFDPSTAVSIKNGGGIRNDIGEVVLPPGTNDPDDAITLPPAANPIAGKEEGQISQFDIQDSLRFNNDLTLLTVTAAELLTLIEHGVAATEPGATPGQFPQVGGIRFSFDPNLPANGRVRSLLVVDSNGAVDGSSSDIVVQDGVLQGDPNRVFRIVTLGFLADGGDEYPFPDRERVDLVNQGLVPGVATFADPGTEQDALAEYLVANFPDNAPFNETDTPIEEDTRIQNLSVRADTVLSP